jgi:hypothetical protein
MIIQLQMQLLGHLTLMFKIVHVYNIDKLGQLSMATEDSSAAEVYFPARIRNVPIPHRPNRF